MWEYDLDKKTLKQTRFPGSHTDISVPLLCDVPDSLIREGMIHPDSAHDIMELFGALEKGIPIVTAEVRIQHKAGMYRWARLSYISIPDPDGKPYRAVGISEDIHAEKMGLFSVNSVGNPIASITDRLTYSFDLTTERLLTSSPFIVQMTGKQNPLYSEMLATINAQSVHADDLEFTRKLLTRDNLLKFYTRGQKDVQLSFRSVSAVWGTGTVNISVYMTENEENGDVIAHFHSSFL
jgi:hypothetical protein